MIRLYAAHMPSEPCSRTSRSSEAIVAFRAGSATVANFPLGPMQHPKTNTRELWHTVIVLITPVGRSLSVPA